MIAKTQTRTGSGPVPFDPDQEAFQANLALLVGNISMTVVVAEETLRFVLLGLLTDGHILLEDTPGVGKTLLAKTLAQSIQGRFTRIQCTPDLLPTDITGSSVFNMQENRFEFRPGPVFTNVLVADEINRAGPRTQSALLEAMAEGQVSAEGERHGLGRPFLVIATQNATEHHGVFPLPDSQLDRFLVSMSLGLPSPTQELEILSRDEQGFSTVSPAVTTEDVLAMQEVVRQVKVTLHVREYLVNLCGASRDHPLVARGVSPRGTVLLQRASQCWAALEGRGYLLPDDVKRVAPRVLPHRILVRPGSSLSPTDIIHEILTTVPVPL